MNSDTKKSQGRSTEQGDSVRDAFLVAARRLFAEKGFDGVSVKELAQATGHNPALVNYYFKTKEGLYRECVMPLVGAGLSTSERTLRTPNSRQDFLTRFELFIEDFIVSHLQQQDLCIILKRDLNTEVVKNLYKEHFTSLGNRLHAFLKAAKKAKMLRSDLDIQIATQYVLSCMFQLVTSERFRTEIGEKCLFEGTRRASSIRQISNCLLYGLVGPEEV